MATDPTNPDTDSDGLLDGEEIDQTISWKRVINDTGDGSHGAYCIYFNMYSDPNTPDTDGDGLLDNEEMSFSCWSDHSRMLMSDPLKWDTDKDSINDYYDPYPWEYNAGNVYNRQAVVEYAMYWADPTEERYNPDFHISGNDCTNFASQCLNAGGYDMTGEWFNVKAYDSDVSFATRVLLKLYDQYTEDIWIWTGTFVEVPKYYDRISEPLYNTGEITIIDETSFEDALESQVKEGDMVFFFNGDEPCHAAVVSKITDDEIYIAAHSYHQTLGPLSQKYESYDKVAIVKIRDDLVE